jgi:membrane associated rhomboid family serine protease
MMSYLTEWVKRRLYTIGLVVMLVLWYGVQLLVASQVGVESAVKWFYFTSKPGTGWLFSPISHNMDDPTHLLGNAVVLFIGGSVIEPHLSPRNYLSVFFTLSVVSTIVPAVGAIIFVDPPWLVAGASGGAYGLWVFASVYRSNLVLEARDVLQLNRSFEPRHSIELLMIVLGILLVILVPTTDVLSQNRTNIVAHVSGMLSGLIVSIGFLID